MIHHPERVVIIEAIGKIVFNPFRVGTAVGFFPRVLPWAEISNAFGVNERSR